MPMRSNPQDATTAWVNHLSQATARITQGVQGVTRPPGQAAAAQSAKWLARVTASQQKWQTNVGRVSLADWQQAMTNVGIPRIAQGAQAKQGKMQAFMQQFLPYLQQGVQRVDTMPNVTLEDGINRAVAMIRHNAAFKKGGTTTGG